MEIELPDGTIAEFPDDMAPEQIQAVLAKQFPAPQQQPQEGHWGHKIGAVTDGLAQGMTLGFSDEIAAGLQSATGLGGEFGEYQKNLAAERARMAENQNLAGGYRMSGEIPGMVATTLGTGGAGALAKAGLKGAPLAAAEGAAMGGLYGAGTSEGDRLTDAAKGAGIGAIAGPVGQKVGNALTSGAGKIAGAFTKKPKPPTPEAIGDAARRAYKATDDADVIFNKQGLQDLYNRVTAKMADDGYLPENQKGVKAAVKALKRLKGEHATFKSVEATRRAVSKGYRPGNKDNNRMLHKVVDEIDDFVANPGSSNVLGGNAERVMAEKAASASKDARKLYAQKSKIASIEDALKAAKGQASKSGIGGNIDNAIRQNLARVQKYQRGFTPDEQKALDMAIHGTKGRNLARSVGRLSPTTGGLSMITNLAAGGGGLAMGTPLPLMATGAGLASKKIGDTLTKKSAKDIQNLIASGGKSSLPTELQKKLQSPELRRLLAQSIMGGGIVTAP